MAATTTTKYDPDASHVRRYLDEGEVEEAVAMQRDVRERANLTRRTACVGCFLGDASPLMHDYGHSCEYGEGAS